ncbi:ABC transporter substrate-binding protein [Bacterioplanes sanyensis]|uniref:substrate-binding periplasmic protein n=1 Tax=Bacterioplanes sanyensis TaxID=1249553 RepID=UPI00167B94EE|nr:transporter substrate-binding domain-containing protein [Bacterioplanes sanyensis]GGY46745.1 ABC transporter substrate-binding protein [Bacterioplanes sanyensis]
MLLSQAHSEDAAQPSVSIAVGSWPPFLSTTQQHQGHIAHLIHGVFASQGYKVELHFMPWARAYREAAAGHHDATAIWMDEEERHLDFHYSAPVMDETFVLFHRRQTPVQWQQFSDLADLSLGGGIAYSYGPAFDQAIEQGVLTLQRVSTTEQNLKRLDAGYIDAFPEEISVGYFNLRQLSDLKHSITHHPKPISKNQSFVLFPRTQERSKVLLRHFNNGLKQLRENGRYQQYFDDFNAGKYDPMYNDVSEQLSDK